MAGERFIARQPIFDTKLDVVAYELLFRSDLENYCKAVDLSQASSAVISDSVLLFDLEKLTDGKGAFVNLDRAGLLAEHARVLSTELATIEVLETVAADDEVVEACRQLKKAGYRIALDDFVDDGTMRPLIELADVIKIDVLNTSPDDVRHMVGALRRPGLQLLAEKVETQEVFDDAVRMGFTLFQGYFFARPVIVSGKDVPGFKAAYLELLKEINLDPFDIDRVETILRRDVAISYKFLRYVNSAAVGLRGRVSSIRETLVLLGQRKARTLASMWALAGLGQDRPDVLLITSLTRARMCEGLAALTDCGRCQSEAFLLGMFSLLDTIMGRPMDQVIASLPVSEDVRRALVEHEGPLVPMLSCVLGYEQGEWDAVEREAAALGVDPATIPGLYLESIPSDVREMIGKSGE